jgi:hypothetical protein
MEYHKVNFFYLFALVFLGGVLLVISTVSYVQGGAPQIREECQSPDGRVIRTIYDSNLPVFAEARMLDNGQWQEDEKMGGSPYVIAINPELYYLGKYTQIWLYRRQCAHIQENHNVVRDRRALNIRDEQQADCLAIRAMQSDPNISFSIRQVSSIERDIERLIRNKQWNNVLAGPQRRISLKRCASSR